jgi:hypothetical protein
MEYFIGDSSFQLNLSDLVFLQSIEHSEYIHVLFKIKTEMTYAMIEKKCHCIVSSTMAPNLKGFNVRALVCGIVYNKYTFGD